MGVLTLRAEVRSPHTHGLSRAAPRTPRACLATISGHIRRLATRGSTVRQRLPLTDAIIPVTTGLCFSAQTGVHLSLTDRGVVKSVNAEFPKMFGYSEQEVVGRPFTDLLKVIDPRSFQKFIQAAMKAGKDKAEAERYFEARHLSGTIFPVSIKIGIDKVRGQPAQAAHTQRWLPTSCGLVAEVCTWWWRAPLLRLCLRAL